MAFDADAFNAFEAASWERQAATYGDFTGRVTSRFAEPLLDAAGVTSGTCVLDVATGPGYVAARAAARHASPVGVDVSPAMLELARQANPGIEFVPGDAEALPLPDEAFDAVVASFLVLHLGRPERLAREAFRVLRNDGKVALSMWDRPERMRLIGVFVDALAETGARPPSGVPDGPPLFRFSDERELASLLEEAGFEDVSVSTVEVTQRVAGVDEFWEGVMGGTVRLGIAIRAMDDDERTRLRGAVERLAEPFAADEGLELPVSVKIASGSKRA
jgi:ubiquinone/menaquinone biosynthesis C-methylase UbiE